MGTLLHTFIFCLVCYIEYLSKTRRLKHIVSVHYGKKYDLLILRSKARNKMSKIYIVGIPWLSGIVLSSPYINTHWHKRVKSEGRKLNNFDFMATMLLTYLWPVSLPYFLYIERA